MDIEAVMAVVAKDLTCTRMALRLVEKGRNFSFVGHCPNLKGPLDFNEWKLHFNKS